MYFLKVREVKSRYYGESPTYEAQIIHRTMPGIYPIVGRSRGHLTAPAAMTAGLKLADKRGLTVENDIRKLRMAEFKGEQRTDLDYQERHLQRKALRLLSTLADARLIMQAACDVTNFMFDSVKFRALASKHYG